MMWMCTHVHAGGMEVRRMSDLQDQELQAVAESPDVGAGTLIQVLWKAASALNHEGNLSCLMHRILNIRDEDTYLEQRQMPPHINALLIKQELY